MLIQQGALKVWSVLLHVVLGLGLSVPRGLKPGSCVHWSSACSPITSHENVSHREVRSLDYLPEGMEWKICWHLQQLTHVLNADTSSSQLFRPNLHQPRDLQHIGLFFFSTPHSNRWNHHRVSSAAQKCQSAGLGSRARSHWCAQKWFMQNATLI